MINHSIIPQVKNHREQKHVECGEGILSEDIQEFEAKHKVVFPPDFREYFMELNGMKGHSSDDDGMRFYPLKEIRQCNYSDREYLVLNKNFYLFADFSFQLFSYAIELLPISSETNSVCLIGAEAPILMAQSFTDFLKIYLAGEAANY